MSGRSALVRAKKKEAVIEKHPTTQQQHLRFPDTQFPRPSHYGNFSFGSIPSSSHAETLSSDSGIFAWQPISPPHKLRRTTSSARAAGITMSSDPSQFTSTVDKSNFRTKWEGASGSFRHTLGRMVGVSKKSKPTELPRLQRSTSFTTNTMSTNLTSPIARSGPSSRSSFQRRVSDHEPQGLPVLVHQGGKKTRSDSGSDLVTRELNNPEGDTIVYLYSHERSPRASLWFRVSSCVLHEAGCTFFTERLRRTDNPESSKGLNEGIVASNAFYQTTQETRLSTLSEDTNVSSLPIQTFNQVQRVYDNIHFELYLTCPGEGLELEPSERLLVIRNFFAILYGSDSICGQTIYEALATLFKCLYRTSGMLSKGIEKASFLIDYLERFHFDDVRMSPLSAASILALSELLRWEEGFLQAFAHCVGMYNRGLPRAPEWKVVSPQTRIFLESAALEVENRLRRAQRFLENFEFADFWPPTFLSRFGTRQAYNNFRQWLYKYCAAETGSQTWPPVASANGIWLGRTKLVTLRNIFNSLYDYLVDHDIIFEETAFSSPPEWRMVSVSGQHFDADVSSGISITSMLIQFDDKHSFPHMPHPYPILPTSKPLPPKPKSSTKHPSQALLEYEAAVQAKAQAYTTASNLYECPPTNQLHDVVVGFSKFERSDFVADFDPRDARIGRFVLVYAILQVLATVAVDTPGVRHTEDINYHVNTTLHGEYPWPKVAGTKPENLRNPSHSLSHPFTVPTTWPAPIPKAQRSLYKPIVLGTFGDGRARADVVIEEAKPRDQPPLPLSTPASPNTPYSPPHSQSPAKSYSPDYSNPPSPDEVAAGVSNVSLSHSESKSPSTWSRVESGSSYGLSLQDGAIGNSGPGSGTSLGGGPYGAGYGGIHMPPTKPLPKPPGGEEDPLEKARRARERERRARVHGFSDYRGEKGW